MYQKIKMQKCTWEMKFKKNDNMMDGSQPYEVWRLIRTLNTNNKQ